MGSAVALPWALHISPPPTRPRRSPLRGSPACQTPPSTPGQPALTPERDSLGVVKVGWLGWTRSRKANPGGRVPRRQGSTVGQGGRVPRPQPWQRCRTSKARAWGSGLMFRGRMGAGRQVRSFGSMAAQGTAPPYARAWLHRQVKHEAPRPRGVGEDHSSAGATLDDRETAGSGPGLCWPHLGSATACWGWGRAGVGMCEVPRSTVSQCVVTISWCVGSVLFSGRVDKSGPLLVKVQEA